MQPYGNPSYSEYDEDHQSSNRNHNLINTITPVLTSFALGSVWYLLDEMASLKDPEIDTTYLNKIAFVASYSFASMAVIAAGKKLIARYIDTRNLNRYAIFLSLLTKEAVAAYTAYFFASKFFDYNAVEKQYIQNCICAKLGLQTFFLISSANIRQ